MKFRRIREKWQLIEEYKGIKNGFNFSVSKPYNKDWHVCLNHKSLDIRYNTLWSKLTFKNLEEAKLFCENFDHRNYECLGKDAKNQ